MYFDAATNAVLKFTIWKEVVLIVPKPKPLPLTTIALWVAISPAHNIIVGAVA